MGKNRTSFTSKAVRYSFGTERVLRGFLADTLTFMRRRRAWPDLDGDLSTWILSMHAWDASGPKANVKFTDEQFAQVLANLDSLCTGMANKSGRIHEQLAKVGKEHEAKLQQAAKSRDIVAFDALLSRAASEALKVAGIPEDFTHHIDKSRTGLLQLIRATRAMLICMALHHKHPLLLILRAADGDKRAVLDLIKVDKMFLNDRCCREALRKASVQEDAAFLAQVQRALQYRAKVNRRDLLHVYIFHLFLFEMFGAPISPLNELWQKLDPVGREYESLEAFEKDVQRRRADFTEMMERAQEAAQALIGKSNASKNSSS